MQTIEEEIKNLQEKCENGQNQFIFVDSTRRSSVWKKFQFIVDVDGNKLESSAKVNFYFIRCKECGQVKDYNSLKGTNSLLNHSCTKISNEKFCEASADEKSKATAAVTKFVIQDLRPFETVNGEGFLNFLQQILIIQHKNKSLLHARSLIPDASTIGRHVHEECFKSKESVKTLFKEINESDVGIAFGIDAWKDPSNKVIK